MFTRKTQIQTQIVRMQGLETLCLSHDIAIAIMSEGKLGLITQLAQCALAHMRNKSAHLETFLACAFKISDCFSNVDEEFKNITGFLLQNSFSQSFY